MIISLLAAAGYQAGLLDPLLNAIRNETAESTFVVVEEPEPKSVAAEIYEGVASEPTFSEAMVSEPEGLPAEDVAVADIEPQEVDLAAVPLIDFSRTEAEILRNRAGYALVL